MHEGIGATEVRLTGERVTNVPGDVDISLGVHRYGVAVVVEGRPDLQIVTASGRGRIAASRIAVTPAREGGCHESGAGHRSQER